MTLPPGATCEHARMRYCCARPCGHLVCPDCDLAYDEGQFDPPDMSEPDERDVAEWRALAAASRAR